MEINKKNSTAIVDENNYPIIEGTLSLCEDITKKRKEELDKQILLAESLWEECDGCTEQDKYFWIKGFISGFRYSQNEL